MAAKRSLSDNAYKAQFYPRNIMLSLEMTLKVFLGGGS